MQERLQKIIARAGIASRRHAEQLILSGQVRVNGRVVRELGTKADAAQDRIEAAGKVLEAPERRVYLVLHKPPEIVSSMADPEGRKTLKNCLRGFPERVYPVGNLEYAAAGLVFLTNDGDLAAEMLKHWAQLEQVYQVKVKGMLTLEDLERLGKEIGVKMKTLRQPDASRGRRKKVASGGWGVASEELRRQRKVVQGHAEEKGRDSRRGGVNYWYEVRMRDTKKEEMRNVLFREQHPVEKLRRIGLGPLTIEGVPVGRYRMLEGREVEELKRVASDEWRAKSRKEKN
jgi:23S rRNA pseudouridine2605 synthase